MNFSTGCPTPDRVRETVFNWLAPYIVNANCLDLFAGSGALGFEALSRGAHSVTFIDEAREVTTYLQQQAIILGTNNASVYCLKVPSGLLPTTPFDIIFLDPPFSTKPNSTLL